MVDQLSELDAEATDTTSATPSARAHRDESWSPQNLVAVINGDFVETKPKVGMRSDDIPIFYAGKVNLAMSETEAGKTWLALAAVAFELFSGSHVLYLDFEDDARSIVNRLLAMGCTPVELRDQLHYIRPEARLDDVGKFEDLVGEIAPSFVVIDGVTEAMTLQGLNLVDNTDVAKFSRLLPRRIADLGPAVLCVDHVVKNSSSRGRYAIGGVHKLNGIDGVAFVLENEQPFGIGVKGRSTVYIAKDRPGALRRHSSPGRDSMVRFAELVVDSRGPELVEVEITPPSDRVANRGDHIDEVKEAIIKVVQDRPDGVRTKTDLRALVKKKNQDVNEALSLLIDEGVVTSDKPFKLVDEGVSETQARAAKVV